MKNILFIFLVILLFSCKKDASYAHLIVGRWIHLKDSTTNIESNGKLDIAVNNYSGSYTDFNADGTGYAQVFLNSKTTGSNFTYSVSGQILTITYSQVKDTNYNLKVLTNNQLITVYSLSNYTFYSYYSK